MREAFEKDLSEIIEKLPRVINDNAKEYIRCAIADYDVEADKKIAEYEGIVQKHEKYERLLLEIQANEPQRVNEYHNRRQQLVAYIHKNSIDEFAKSYGLLISNDTIISTIKQKGFKKRGARVERAGREAGMTPGQLRQGVKKGPIDNCNRFQ